MKFFLLFLSFLFSFQLFAQKEHTIPNSIELTISDHGLAKSSSSSYLNYSIQDYKLDYTYNYTGSMGRSNADEHANKKFAHREQREVYHFLEEEGFLDSEKLNFEGDDSGRIVEISLRYVHNGESTSWTIKGGRNLVEGHERYDKIIALENLIRELGRLSER